MKTYRCISLFEKLTFLAQNRLKWPAFLSFFLALALLLYGGVLGHARLVKDLPLAETKAWKERVALLEKGRNVNNVSPLSADSFSSTAISFVENYDSMAEAFYQGQSAKSYSDYFEALYSGDSTYRSIPSNWQSFIKQASKKHGVPPELLAAVIQVESNFNARAVSPRGAKGAMQIMPITGRHLGLTNFFDPKKNIDAGARYLAELLEEFPSTSLALAAYNAGPTRVRKANGIPPYKETQDYVRRVTKVYRNYMKKMPFRQ